MVETTATYSGTGLPATSTLVKIRGIRSRYVNVIREVSHITRLQTLHLEMCSVKYVPNNLLSGPLQTLVLKDCCNWKEFPGVMPHLECLEIYSSAMQLDSVKVPSLERLRLVFSDSTICLSNLMNLKNLQYITAISCSFKYGTPNKQWLQRLPNSLKFLYLEDIQYSIVDFMNTEVSPSELILPTNLTECVLETVSCISKIELRSDFLFGLRNVSIISLNNLISLPKNGFGNLDKLKVKDCPLLKDLGDISLARIVILYNLRNVRSLTSQMIESEVTAQMIVSELYLIKCPKLRTFPAMPTIVKLLVRECSMEMDVLKFPNLLNLCMTTCKGNIPQVSLLRNLQTLYIEDQEMTNQRFVDAEGDVYSQLDMLPDSLIEISVSKMVNLCSLMKRTKELPLLRILKLQSLDLDIIGNTLMPELKDVQLFICPWMQRLPQFVVNASKLVKLFVDSGKAYSANEKNALAVHVLEEIVTNKRWVHLNTVGLGVVTNDTAYFVADAMMHGFPGETLTRIENVIAAGQKDRYSAFLLRSVDEHCNCYMNTVRTASVRRRLSWLLGYAEQKADTSRALWIINEESWRLICRHAFGTPLFEERWEGVTLREGHARPDC